MAIEIKLIKEDGSNKKYSRPDTTLYEMEEFKDMRAGLQKKQRELQALDYKELVDVDFREIERENDKTQIEYVVELFKPHDAFTYEEFMNGIKSKELEKTLIDIFTQIDPSVGELHENSKKKKNPSR